MKTGRTSPSRRIVFYSVALWLAVTGQAKATDEIQVYNAGIAEVGQFTIQQHLNYIPLGVKDPPFPGWADLQRRHQWHARICLWPHRLVGGRALSAVRDQGPGLLFERVQAQDAVRVAAR
jgi:hypothetical protein